MGTLRIKVANFFARQSCEKWQSVRLIRKLSRHAYRSIMERGAKSYPYANMSFANWPESDEAGNYTLISDSANFVIRRSPSYVAWQIKEVTGSWPKLPTPGKRAPGEHKFDAKHWDEVLEFNGWQKVAEGPTLQDGLTNVHFVGVMPGEGEFGQLVWFECFNTSSSAAYQDASHRSWYVTTYQDFQKTMRLILVSQPGIMWYREPSRATRTRSA